MINPVILSGPILLFSLLVSTSALPSEVRIGALFDNDEKLQEVAFRHAVDMINGDHNQLAKTKLLPHILNFEPQDSFHASVEVCHILLQGVAAVFGPESSQTANHVQSICDAFRIPHLETRWQHGHHQTAINLLPHPSHISNAFAHLVKGFGWKSFTVIYEKSDSLAKLQSMLTKDEWTVRVKQLPDMNDYRPFLEEIKKSGETRIVLDIERRNEGSALIPLLQQLQQMGMLTKGYSYIITTLELFDKDLDEFKYGESNITAFRLINPENVEAQSLIQKLNQLSPENQNLLQPALTYDAVHLFAKALDDLERIQRIDIKPLSCGSNQTWIHGHRVVNYIKLLEIRGITGNIKFDKRGFRSSLELEVVSLTKDGLQTIGTWDIENGLNITLPNKHTPPVDNKVFNKTLIVTTRMNEPYISLRNTNGSSGNERFEGFNVDLMDEISYMLGFDYEIKIVPDQAYGYYNPETKQWTGMIRELLEERADLALADMTITSHREQVVDFSVPFMNVGVGLLYKKPVKVAGNLFGFLAPLSYKVWLSVMASYLGVSLLIFGLARLTPKEKRRSQCEKETMEPTNRLSFLNSFWFSIGSLTQQGSNVVPSALSTRILAAIWWFFVALIIASYTANLAALLTSENIDTPIGRIEDVASQKRISFGAVKGGSTSSFIKNSDAPYLRQIWSKMESNPTSFSSSTSEGVKRVNESNGRYGFFMESATIEYVTMRNCQLTQVGKLMDSRGYAIAMRPNSEYRTAINVAILKLQESGRLDQIKYKWWSKGSGSCQDETSYDNGKPQPLGMSELSGTFIVLAAGMAVSILVAGFEIWWK